MNYWLLKTEPGTYSWDDLVKKGNDSWDGVRNYQARNNLRLMKKGDVTFVYHSGKNPGIVGLAEITREHYPDPAAHGGDWLAVDIKSLHKLNHFLPLQEIKQTAALKNMYLVRNTRLSVQPVTEQEYTFILQLGNKGGKA